MSCKKMLCALAAMTTTALGVEAQQALHQSDLRMEQSDRGGFTDLKIRDGQPGAAAVLLLNTSGAAVRSRAKIGSVLVAPVATVPMFRLDAKGSRDFRTPDRLIPDGGLWVQAIAVCGGQLHVSNVLKLAPRHPDAKPDRADRSASDSASTGGTAEAVLSDYKGDGQTDLIIDQDSESSDEGERDARRDRARDTVRSLEEG